MVRRPRPYIFVLAGVNGAGKSSVGGNLLVEQGMDWFNPDSFARQLTAKSSWNIEDANSAAWHFGRRTLETAITSGANFAFETTLGADSIPKLLAEASATHAIVMWYCGLESPELHIQRVRQRVSSGGHDIPEAKIRERWNNSRKNLIRLLPYLQHLQVFDNSVQVERSHAIPSPDLLLEVVEGKILKPNATDLRELKMIPAWAMPIVEAALVGPARK